MSKNEALRILFSLHLITQNSSGFPQSHIDMLPLLEKMFISCIPRYPVDITHGINFSIPIRDVKRPTYQIRHITF